ncbi:DNA polymerase IV [Corynebacterium heidelbergense]|nr:DNA polymerase IV [Corynebacterium heidelbergense]WCZ36382.1 DNA polymerase IV [Corynebacterium heidelbergense]
MPRWVAHIDMDAFYASVEQLTRPTLRGRPVLVGGSGGRGVVAGASYEARAYGARSAMPMGQAIRLCRSKAVVVRPRAVVYAAASERIFQVLREHSGIVEQLSVDEGFAEPKVETAEQARRWAEQLQGAVEEETGLPCSIGLAHTKMDAKMASDIAKPHGITVVTDREELFYPRPVGEVWGIGKVAQSRLRALGVRTIGQLVAMDPRDVEATLGSVGLEIQRMAAGHDERPVAPRGRAKQISAERTLATDARTYAEAVDVLEQTAQHAHRRLLRDGRAARTVTVKTRSADFSLHTKSSTLGVPTDNLPVLLAAARQLLSRPEDTGAIRLVGVGFSGLVDNRQEALFPDLGTAGVAAPGGEGALVSAVTPGGEGESVSAPEPPPIAVPGVAVDPQLTSGSPANYSGTPTPTVNPAASPTRWEATRDVYHPDYGHGWVQGSGVGRVTVRFETRATGPGRIVTFPVEDEKLRFADPLDSLAWG